jgi:hypothetical protein
VILRHLALSVSLRAEPASDRLDGGGACCFCGGIRGSNAPPACVLCQLVRHLDRPRIDDEALLIWLPEMSQPALNMLMRSIQSRLRALGERLDLEGVPALDTEDRPWLYHAQRVLIARREAAAGRLGSDRPSELADALLRLAPAVYARRTQLLAGVRLLPSGRFFDGEIDILPTIVDSWRSPAAATTGASA